MKTLITNLSGLLIFTGFFCFCLSQIPGNRKVIMGVRAQIPQKQIYVFTETILSQEDSINLIAQKMELKPVEEDGEHIFMNSENQILSFLKEDENSFLDLEEQNFKYKTLVYPNGKPLKGVIYYSDKTSALATPITLAPFIKAGKEVLELE